MLSAGTHPHAVDKAYTWPACGNEGLVLMDPKSTDSNKWMQAQDRLSCEQVASQLGVSPEVHVDDLIFRFCYDHPSFPSKELAINYYFQDAAVSAKKLRNTVNRWMGNSDRPLNILEFASGYGAVTRHAKKELEPHKLTSCDIHPQANDFMSKHFQVRTLQSHVTPEAVDLAEKYDAIFVISFFSHMPRETWFRWLSKLYSALANKGIMLFTACGKVVLEQSPLAAPDEEGYWFGPTTEQRDLDVSNYGATITLKSFVDAKIALLPELDYLYFEQAGWWNYQDVYVIRKGGFVMPVPL
jgi:SAM-dependent methyltransferase